MLPRTKASFADESRASAETAGEYGLRLNIGEFVAAVGGCVPHRATHGDDVCAGSVPNDR